MTTALYVLGILLSALIFLAKWTSVGCLAALVFSLFVHPRVPGDDDNTPDKEEEYTQ